MKILRFSTRFTTRYSNNILGSLSGDLFRGWTLQTSRQDGKDFEVTFTQFTVS